MLRLLVVVVSIMVVSNVIAGESPVAWPDGQVAAVSLSYDDALESQLDNALPSLDKYGFKASFYLTLAYGPMRERMADWRAAAANGHELGNHTIWHGCDASLPGRDWVAPHLDLNKRTVAELVDEVVMANTMLEALDSHTERTLTPPCGDELAGGENYVDAVADLFVAVKTRDEGMPAGMSVIEGPVEMSGPELVELVRKHTRDGMLINVLFHGIGGDYLDVSTEAHDELLRFLDENRDTYWTAPYIDIMRHVQGQR